MADVKGLQIDDVIQLLSILAEEANLKVTVQESLKGGLITGLTTIVGGLLGGRMGLAIGAIAGGVGAAAMAKDFQSVASVILNMDRENKEKLFAKAQECFSKASLNDIGKVQEAIKDPEMKSKLLKVIVDHMEGQLKMQVVD